MKELLLLAGGLLFAAGILTGAKKAPTLESDDAGITPNDESDQKPDNSDSSDKSGGLDPV